MWKKTDNIDEDFLIEVLYERKEKKGMAEAS